MPPSAVEAIAERQQTWAALLLAWVAGFSDAIGFLVLQQLGASFMSGNSMATGASLGEMDWRSMFRYGFAILSFILGIILGILVSAQVRQWGIRSALAIVSGLEALCLLAFLIIGSIAFQHGAIPPSPAGMFYLCIALLTVAMGLQTIVIQRVHGQGVHTTFVTGMLNSWTQALIHYLFWLHMQATERHLRQALRIKTTTSLSSSLPPGWHLDMVRCGSSLWQRLRTAHGPDSPGLPYRRTCRTHSH